MDEVSARDELYEIAEVLREADESEKKFKALKEEVRGPFFELISEIVRQEIPLARQTISVEVQDDFDIDTWRARNYPEWRICGLDQKPGVMLITLEENEAFKKFEFNHNGFKYGRSIRMEGRDFDAEGFYMSLVEDRENLPDELFDCVKVQTITTYRLDETKAIAVMAEHPETVVLFQEYTRPGTPKAALLPIRPVKEDEE